MNKDILDYNDKLDSPDIEIVTLLATEIDQALFPSESKLYHAHPAWFIDGNPLVGYSKRKNSIQLLFWSGQSFDEPGLKNEGSFKAADANYTNVDQVNVDDLRRWLKKSISIQWDYKNIVKRKGVLERLV
ncbi:MAG: DUF1801 domain-containing protein [Patescibacteria group bacterium]